MELGLSMSLGDPSNSKPFCGFIEKARHRPHNNSNSNINTGLGFCMGLSIGPTPTHQDHEEEVTKSNNQVQLDLLPNTPVPRYPHSFPWASSENGIVADTEVVSSPSPNSAASSFQIDDEEGNTRKKLRLSKEQSAFLEESFKEHNTLNPKQKVALAKQLKLRARQVEVWFQNRRARTKLKQTEVDCEYLKRCCDTLTQDNRRLQKEVSDLRALKTSTPFHMHLPATTLTMCPSCERVNFYPKT